EDPDITDEEKSALIVASAQNNLSAAGTANRYLWAIEKLVKAAESKAERAKELSRQAAVLNNQADWLKTSIKTYLEMKGIDKLELPDWTPTIRNNPVSLEIIDEKAVPVEFVEIRQETVIKK